MGLFDKRRKKGEDMNSAQQRGARVYFQIGTYIVALKKLTAGESRQKGKGAYVAAEFKIISVTAGDENSNQQGTSASDVFMIDKYDIALDNYKSLLCALMDLTGDEDEVEVEVNDGKGNRTTVALDWNDLADWACGQYGEDGGPNNLGEQPLADYICNVQASPYTTRDTQRDIVVKAWDVNPDMRLALVEDDDDDDDED